MSIMNDQVTKMYPPKWVEESITKWGGLCPLGKPNFRVIWGGNRTHLIGGLFSHVAMVKKEDMIIGSPEVGVVTKVAEMREVLKYHPFRWHLERWIPPDVYGTPEEWYTQTWDQESNMHTQGDYPYEGDYEHVFFLGQCSHMKPGDTEWCQVCQVGMGEFIPLEENIHMLERQIWMLKQSQGYGLSEDERLALFARENIKRQVYRKSVSDRVQGSLRPQLALQPTSWQSGTNSKCSVPEADPRIIEALMLPNKGRRTSFKQSNNFLPARKQEDLNKIKEN